ncbi:MAG: hypothetical protein E7034_04665 [Akkermansiaceae bacterium]|nr:hypothetical protein [Akkermansiaceae bacterium]
MGDGIQEDGHALPAQPQEAVAAAGRRGRRRTAAMPVVTARRAMAVAMMMTGRRAMVAVFCHQILRARDDDRSRHCGEFGSLGAF